MIRTIFVGLLLLIAQQAFSQTITTIAGDTAGFGGDNDSATKALLAHPFGVCVDNSGNVYIADRGNARIRMINSLGFITTIAGTGTNGYNGDNIAATTAQLNDPVGVVTDYSGNVYIAEKGNNRIRKVNASGIITTVAGTGVPGFSGDSAAATAAQINAPRGLAIGPDDNLYIADQGNHRVRKINSQGIITTVAGNGVQGYNGDSVAAIASQLNNPANICFDVHSNMYIADVANERIRKVDAGGMITTVAGTGTAGFSGDNGPATSAMLNEPISIAMDNIDRLYIADGWNNRIRMVNASGIIRTIAGNGTAGYSGDGGAPVAASLHFPYGVAYDGLGNIYIADYENHRVRFINNPTDVANATVKNVMQVYPNPCKNDITISVPKLNAKNAKLTISNMYGALVQEAEVNPARSNNIKLNLVPGIYMVKVQAGNEQWREKIVVQ